MYHRILLALDLEGVNLVAGKPYEGLSRESEDWYVARAQALVEINAAADALFAAGAARIALWDNHGGGRNIDPAGLDPRIELLDPELTRPRMYFAKGEFDCICFFGYHAMEGTLGGVLAHTMSSISVQYYKLNGRYIGEIDMDAYIAAEYGMPACFFAAGDIACRQARYAVPGIVTVETKRELGRNKADYRDNEALVAEIRERIVEAVSTPAPVKRLRFPATVEKSFKRMEDAAKKRSALCALGIDADHPEDEILGRDAHTVVATVHDIFEFIKCI